MLKMVGKKAKILIPIIIVVITIIIVFAGYKTYSYQVSQARNKESVRQFTENVTSKCLKIETVAYDAYSYLKKDVSLCDKAKSPSGCKDFYYLMLAAENKFTDCSAIPADYDKHSCEAYSTKDCSKFKAEDRNFCEALIKDDVTICEKEADINNRVACNNIFYMTKALMNGDTKECDNVKNYPLDNSTWMNSPKQRCIYLVNKNPQQIEDNIAKRCYEDEIVATFNSPSCKYIPSQYRTSCEQRIQRMSSCISNLPEEKRKDCIAKEIDLHILCGEDGIGPTLDALGRTRANAKVPNLCSF